MNRTNPNISFSLVHIVEKIRDAMRIISPVGKNNTKQNRKIFLSTSMSKIIKLTFGMNLFTFSWTSSIITFS